MRTTITLDDRAFEFANQYAAARALRLGEAVSELILRGEAQSLPRKSAAKKINGVWVFDVSKSAPTLTSADVKAFLEDGA